jgi:hypothetical protein
MAEPADQILTIGLSAVAGYGGRMAQDWWTARRPRRDDRIVQRLRKRMCYELEPPAMTRAQPARERARSRPSRISSSPNRYSLP